MTFEGLGEMIEGYSADTGAGKFPLALMGVPTEGLACPDPGARTPIGASGNFSCFWVACRTHWSERSICNDILDSGHYDIFFFHHLDPEKIILVS
jgi:hypothetical protein